MIENPGCGMPGGDFFCPTPYFLISIGGSCDSEAGKKMKSKEETWMVVSMKNDFKSVFEVRQFLPRSYSDTQRK
jgi:hypothetical protein